MVTPTVVKLKRLSLTDSAECSSVLTSIVEDATVCKLCAVQMFRGRTGGRSVCFCYLLLLLFSWLCFF